MSVYIDPATALRLAHESRADDIRRSTQRRRARAARRSAAGPPSARRHGLAPTAARLVMRGTRLAGA